MIDFQELFEQKLKKSLKVLSPREQLVLHHVRNKTLISRNVRDEDAEKLTFGQRLADKVASFGGSWTFIIIFIGVLISWIALNVVILSMGRKPFDPYPFILLNLFLSMTAAIQAPVIMMSQNRQSAHDRIEAEHDYEVNLKAELEILALHEKIDDLRDQQWKRLMEVQQEQINKLLELEKLIKKT